MRVYYIVCDWKDLMGAGGIEVGKFAGAMPSSKCEGMITNIQVGGQAFARNVDNSSKAIGKKATYISTVKVGR